MLHVHSTHEKLENNFFTLKEPQVLHVYTTPEKLESAKIISLFLFLCLKKNSDRSTPDYRVAMFFGNLRFENVFCSHQNAKAAFSNSSGLKLCFVDGRPNRRNNAALSNFLGVTFFHVNRIGLMRSVGFAPTKG